MREILFRGKRTDNGEWVEGGFHKHIKRTPCPIGDSLEDDDIAYLIIESGFSDWNMPKPLFSYQVDPETVGQYTGLKDSTGKRIFEGDILEFEDLGEEGYEYKEGFDFINAASVVFVKGRFELENFRSDNSGVLEEMNDDHEDFISIFAYSKIIGNIHDNPELLEVQE